MRQRFQVALGFTKPVESPLTAARDLLQNVRSVKVVEARSSNHTLYMTLDHETRVDRQKGIADIKNAVEIVAEGKSIRVLGVREMERKLSAIEKVTEILEPTENERTIRRAFE